MSTKETAILYRLSGWTLTGSSYKNSIRMERSFPSEETAISFGWNEVFVRTYFLGKGNKTGFRACKDPEMPIYTIRIRFSIDLIDCFSKE